MISLLINRPGRSARNGARRSNAWVGAGAKMPLDSALFQPEDDANDRTDHSPRPDDALQGAEVSKREPESLNVRYSPNSGAKADMRKDRLRTVGWNVLRCRARINQALTYSRLIASRNAVVSASDFRW
jgi:hypothetical protein